MSHDHRTTSEPVKSTASDEVLFRCPDCETPMEFGQKACPACGYRRPAAAGRTLIQWILFIVIMAAILAAGIFLNGNS